MCEEQSLAKIIKKVLNVSFLKLQQSTVNVKSLNVCALSLDTHSLKISNLKKEIKKKDLIFMKINAV